ncbi:MAG: Crp/Fnr family transcriptional regulator [Candidatus Baltobacteraceae bacterium]
MPNDALGNRILDSLPELELAAIRRDLDRVTVKAHDTLYIPNERIDRVYFPINCVLSVLAIMQNGDAVEISSIGHEGLSGSQLVFLADRPEREMICQVAGDAKCMTAEAFLKHFEKAKGFQRMIFAYTESLFNSMAQSIACNRLHVLNERCARWLLSTEDRVGRSDFYLTQEFLAIMLGTSRPAVTVAAGALQEAGLIRYHRGHVKILDREKLEAASCECYEDTARSLERVMNTNKVRIKAV